MLKIFLINFLAVAISVQIYARELKRLPYNNPKLVVDLAVGLWAIPLPMDWDSDGDLDLVVSCPDVPYQGTYFFENQGNLKLPVFKPAVRVGSGLKNMRVSFVDGKPRILTPGREWTNFLGQRFHDSIAFYPDRILVGPGLTRADQRHLIDYDGDGILDIVVGIGYWGDYGWDNSYDAQGNWKNGPLHGYVYLVRNRGTNKAPEYERPAQILAGNDPIDVYGMPSPNLADFDNDGDLDLLCGEFVDSFTYFENVGSRNAPKYTSGKKLFHNAVPLRMELCMIVPTAVDWDDDGDIDLIVGQEDGRVAFVENLDTLSGGQPTFALPVYFQQEAADLKFGVLATPVGFDWDDDGDEDFLAGNSAGFIGLIENLGIQQGNDTPTWAAPKNLTAGGETIRIVAGENGSIQGPCESKWGYTTLSVADWDHDGLPDLVVNSIWGKVIWFRNVGTRTTPSLAKAEPIYVEWPGTPPKPVWNWWEPKSRELVTQWRTTPVIIDWDHDNLNDLVMLDHEGYLSLFRRERNGKKLVLLPGERLFKFHDAPNQPMQLNSGIGGKSGRRKLCIVDWDGDGAQDIIINSENANFLRNESEGGPPWIFSDQGALGDRKLTGHTTSPTTVDWNSDGQPELIIGAEDGHFYYLAR